MVTLTHLQLERDCRANGSGADASRWMMPSCAAAALASQVGRDEPDSWQTMEPPRGTLPLSELRCILKLSNIDSKLLLSRQPTGARGQPGRREVLKPYPTTPCSTTVPAELAAALSDDKVREMA